MSQIQKVGKLSLGGSTLHHIPAFNVLTTEIQVMPLSPFTFQDGTSHNSSKECSETRYHQDVHLFPRFMKKIKLECFKHDVFTFLQQYVIISQVLHTQETAYLEKSTPVMASFSSE